MIHNKIYIYGKHALMEALLHAPKAVKKVFLAPHVEDSELMEVLKKTGVPHGTLGTRGTLDVEKTAAHQGVIGLLDTDKIVQSYENFSKNLKVTPNTSLLLLDEVQDPHNVGAMIRSAAAFGVSAVLIPEHNQAPVTGAVVKVSSGMVFRVPIVKVGNVNSTLIDLKEKGFWIYGLAGEGTNPVTKEKFDAPAVFVVGNESEGIRLKTRETCDILLSIPMNPQCESLNVAASAAVTLYAWSAQHPEALR